MKVLSLSLVALVIPTTQGFWRMPCSRSGVARIDPLIYFGESSAHAHAVHGSSGLGMTADYPTLVNSSCTSCQVAEDKSAYWTPALYFKNAATGEFTLVPQVGGMLAYYLLYSGYEDSSIQAFPEGFQMVAGDNDEHDIFYPTPEPEKSLWNVAPYNTQKFLSQVALGFNCLNYKAAPEASLSRHGLPKKSEIDEKCIDGLRLELMFPSCWNGKDVDSANHKDHVAYPSLCMTGTCPDGFPVRLPSLFFETIWDVYAFKGIDGEFVLSNGDTTGYSYHGDFIAGWPSGLLQKAVDTCTSPNGLIQDCPLFTVQDESIYNTCNITLPSELESEKVVGPLANLPGKHVLGSDASSAALSPSSKTSIIVSSERISYSPVTSSAQSALTGYTSTSYSTAPSGSVIELVMIVVEDVVTVNEREVATIAAHHRHQPHAHHH